MQILSKHEKLTVQYVQHYVTKYATTSLELKVAKKMINDEDPEVVFQGQACTLR